MKLTTLLSSLLVALSLTLNSRGLASFDMKEPGVAFPSEFPRAAQTAIMDALKHPDSKFVGGSFINSFTNLRYEGNTRALNLFMEGLAQIPGIDLSVRFHAGNPQGNCDWSVAHMGGNPRAFTVHISLKSPRLTLDELVIPAAKGPPLPETAK